MTRFSIKDSYFGNNNRQQQTLLLDVSMKIWAIVLKEKIIEINQEIIIERLLVVQEVSDNLDSSS